MPMTGNMRYRSETCYVKNKERVLLQDMSKPRYCQYSLFVFTTGLMGSLMIGITIELMVLEYIIIARIYRAWKKRNKASAS